MAEPLGDEAPCPHAFGRQATASSIPTRAGVSSSPAWGLSIISDSISGDSGFQPGYLSAATGETLGADYRFTEHFAAGLAAGYVNSYADIAYHGGNVYGQSARLGAYGMAYKRHVPR